MAFSMIHEMQLTQERMREAARVEREQQQSREQPVYAAPIPEEAPVGEHDANLAEIAVRRVREQARVLLSDTEAKMKSLEEQMSGQLKSDINIKSSFKIISPLRTRSKNSQSQSRSEITKS